MHGHRQNLFPWFCPQRWRIGWVLRVVSTCSWGVQWLASKGLWCGQHSVCFHYLSWKCPRGMHWPNWNHYDLSYTILGPSTESVWPQNGGNCSHFRIVNFIPEEDRFDCLHPTAFTCTRQTEVRSYCGALCNSTGWELGYPLDIIQFNNSNSMPIARVPFPRWRVMHAEILVLPHSV